MNGIRARRLVLLTASTALAAGALSLSSSASAAPATSHPASVTRVTVPADIPDPVGSKAVRPIKYLTTTSPALYTKRPLYYHVSGIATGGDRQDRMYSAESSPALYVTDRGTWR
ncbi:hypothetical protein ACIA98_36190 [Streptomyces sp. NPDC051366]|uniref:hypothetical protein n=1 Tax=Streptomyces sp. NPDC051366 TaxID=3365652 RepID=UPI00379DBBE2